jgi:uncharacterized protein (TIGR00251 family)
MHITITAKPKKKKEYVQRISPTHYIVSVKEPAREGRANQAIIKALAQYFHVSQSEIVLVTGQTSKLKIFDVPDRLADFEVLPSQKKLF